MSNKVYGFVGVESYDLILALGRTLAVLNCKVLLLDKSSDSTLMYTATEDVQSGSEVDYYNMSMVCKKPVVECEPDRYDYIFINFGRTSNDEDLARCDEIYLVTDYQLSSVLGVASVPIAADQSRFAIFRDRIDGRIDLDYAVLRLECQNITENNVYYLEDGPQDLANRVACQYDSVFYFDGMSSTIRDFILSVLNIDFTNKEIINAMRTLYRKK